MDYAGAIALSMIIVFAIGAAGLSVGIPVWYHSTKHREARTGIALTWLGGIFVFLALVGWIASIWLGFAQAAAAGS